MKRNLFARLGSAMLVCLLAAQLCVPALAEGEGETVYINDDGDLLDLAEHCAYDAWSRGKTVVLQRDISLGGVEFLPIANFGGTFDGGGHTISGLNVVANVSPAGLFGTVAETGVVRDLTVEGSVVPGGSADVVGGVAGRCFGQIENCSFTGTVEGEKRVGGIVGETMATGAVRRCSVSGGVFGKNMTGGVTGANHGTLSGCSNRAYVNTNTLDPSISFDKLDLNFSNGLSALTSPDIYNVTVDSGGVAGFSDGELLSCRNYGSVGYQHIGYNVGGVAGRSSGHMATCANDGHVYGCREVGGVVGVAEPYIRLDLKGSSLEQVRGELNALSRTIDQTVSDAENASGTISARLTTINQGVDEATDHVQTITGSLADIYDGTVSEINRGSDILSNTIGQLETVTEDLAKASATMTAALDHLYQSMQIMEQGDAFGELSIAGGDLEAASALVTDGAEEMKKGLDDMNRVISSLTGIPTDAERQRLSAAVDEVVEGFNLIVHGRMTSNGSRDEKGAQYYLEDAGRHFESAMRTLHAASSELENATGDTRDASNELTATLREADSLLNYLKAQEKLAFTQLGTENDAEADALYDTLRGVSNNIELLNQEARASTDTLLADVRQINRQFNALMNTLLDAVEEAEGVSASTVVEDTSDEDIDAVVSGKVLLCSNAGTVSGDIDVGGVAGAMMVYNELDPENDDGTASSVLHRRYELKSILQDCINSGSVLGKRDNVGAVCGSATLGVISGCEGYGSAESESGDFVGGVAGFADNIVRKCWAKSSLSGTRYVGGVVGGGREDGSVLRVEECRTLVDIPRSTQYAGAIAGFDVGTFSNNRFVSDTLAGIDRVSYGNRAEPITYGELLEEAGVPQEFRRFTLNFVADGSVIRSAQFDYGGSFDASMFPEIPPVEGKFARWDREELNDLRFDTTVTALYLPRPTALAGSVARSAARPAFLVEGAFDDTSAFDAVPAIFDFDAGQEGPWRILRSYRRAIQEQWQLTLPEDGAARHVVRYLPPEGISGRLELYAQNDDGSWRQLETGAMGSYLTFEAPGDSLGLTVVSAATPWWVWALVNVFLLGAAALLAEPLICKRPKQAPQTEEDKAKLALQKKKRRKLRIILIAAVFVLGAAVGAVVRLAPRISDSMGLYRLVRNYAERSELDMELRLTGRVGGKEFRTDVPLFTTDCEGKRVSCVLWQEIPVYFCDGVMLLENGKAYRAEGVLADYSELLFHAAGLYRLVDVDVSEENGVKTYRASAEGEAAQRVLSTLLPGMAESLPEPEAVEMDLIVTDGELTSLKIDWQSDGNSVDAELSVLHGEREHTLPQAVRGAVSLGGENAEEIGEALKRLLLAWTEAASRDTLTADVALKANCGPLLVDERLTWQRTRDYAQELSCLSRRGSTLYYTDEAACTDGGLAISRSSASYTGTSELIRLAYEAFLLGEADCVEIADGWRYTVTLDTEAMGRFAALIVPDIRTMELVPQESTVYLDIKDELFSTLYVQCKGSVRIVRSDIPAALSARLDFDSDAAFQMPSGAVLSALGLAE